MKQTFLNSLKNVTTVFINIQDSHCKVNFQNFTQLEDLQPGVFTIADPCQQELILSRISSSVSLLKNMFVESQDSA